MTTQTITAPQPDVEARMEAIATRIESLAFTWLNEYSLQAAIADAMTCFGHEVGVEVYNAAGRFDLVVDGIPIEVKTQGSLTAVIRQLGRYAASGGADGLILVTTTARLSVVPPKIHDVPVRVVTLLGRPM